MTIRYAAIVSAATWGSIVVLAWLHSCPTLAVLEMIFAWADLGFSPESYSLGAPVLVSTFAFVFSMVFIELATSHAANIKRLRRSVSLWSVAYYTLVFTMCMYPLYALIGSASDDMQYSHFGRIGAFVSNAVACGVLLLVALRLHRAVRHNTPSLHRSCATFLILYNIATFWILYPNTDWP